MRFEEFLTWHQDLLSAALSTGEIDQKEAKDFHLNIEICINAYVEIHDRLQREVRHWDNKTKELCSLRDQVQKLRKDELHGE